ncbi:hypothetical protein ACGFIF_20145 [Kribbella sp. NPDC049174]|uniref:hypothetical protein n=1 Tax=Kribbella sp. NPDC049174 TaxID=3364112 RepID=UPI003711DCAB
MHLEFDPDATFDGPGLETSLPLRPDGTRYASYAETIADLARPAVFENRPTYRLLTADLAAARPVLRFGRGTYFDSINTGEAAAHEYAADRHELRRTIGDPCDPTRRPVNVAISTLTIRSDTSAGSTFYLHWRDPAKVGHAGGLYQVVPSGIFQPTADENTDFSLWRNLIRELSEELLGLPETYTHSINYKTWPFAADLTDALANGSIRAYCVGLGVDPLTFATDLLTVLSIDAELFDTLFPKVAKSNEEGQLLTPKPFTAEFINTYTRHEPMQAAGAALLQLAWDHQLG